MSGTKNLASDAIAAAAVADGADLSRVAVVVIGRNEGARLRDALESVADRRGPGVYVDSGSSDGSAGLARSMGVEVVELDAALPMSAARARNEGFERISAGKPSPEFVQFLDGDCALAEGWLDKGVRELDRRPEVAIVCGRLRERRPDESIFGRLCALEWDRPAGDVSECGGIFLIRASAFRAAGGFDPRFVAGEDPELCLRIRRSGWKISRLESEMAVHDAAIHRFSQWWTRAVRTGHAYAQSAAVHGGSPERYRVRECRSIRVWALWLPLLIAALGWATGGWGWLGFLAYPIQAIRIARRERVRGTPWSVALIHGGFCVLSKWPQFQGLLRYRRTRGVGPTIIEYKGVDVSSTRGGTP